MSLGSWMAKVVGRRKVKAWRSGKAGAEMKRVMQFLDGKKRYLLLLLFMGQELVRLASGGESGLADALRIFLAILGWSPDDAVVSTAVIAQFAAALWAIVQGIQKDRRERARSAMPAVESRA